MARFGHAHNNVGGSHGVQFGQAHDNVGTRRCRRRSCARLNYLTLLSLGGPCHLQRESHPSPIGLVFWGNWPFP
jgi:hypothetical protein